MDALPSDGNADNADAIAASVSARTIRRAGGYTQGMRLSAHRRHMGKPFVHCLLALVQFVQALLQTEAMLQRVSPGKSMFQVCLP